MNIIPELSILEEPVSAASQPAPDKKARAEGLIDRRRAYQAHMCLEKAGDLIADLRDQAKKHRRFDDMQHLREMAFHLARSRAHLRSFCKRRFNREPEDLKGYR